MSFMATTATTTAKATNYRRYQQTRIGMTGNWNIRAESVKITKKQDTEEYTATNNSQPYAIAFGAETFEIDLSGVDPMQREFFEGLYKKQRLFKEPGELPAFVTYGYDGNTGELVETAFYRGVYIEEISVENSKPFDVKMKALKNTGKNG